MMSDPSMIGPSLPPNLIAARSTKPDDDPSDKLETVIGPQLPSTDKLYKGNGVLIKNVSYGPALPPGITCGPSIPEESEYTQGWDLLGERVKPVVD